MLENTDSIIGQSLNLFKPETLKRLLENLQPHCFNDSSCRKAAVYAILDSREHVLIIQKPCYNDGYPWGGQLALPGGHMEVGDASFLDTAFREVFEEVGIAPENLNTIGSLGSFPTLHNVSIEAFLGFVGNNVKLRPQAAEVERVIWVSLAELMRTHLHNHYFDRQVAVKDLVYPVESQAIWGATAKIIWFLLNAVISNRNLYV